MTRFVILSLVGHGGGFLSRLLSSHPNIGCQGDIFRENVRRSDVLGQERAWLRTFWQQRALDAREVQGWTFYGQQTGFRPLRLLLQDTACRKIIVHRRNPLQALITYQIYQRHRAPRSVKVLPLQKDTKAWISPENCSRYEKYYRKYFSQLERIVRLSRADCLSVSYEELVAGRYEQVLDLLEQDYCPLVSRCARRTQGKLSDYACDLKALVQHDPQWMNFAYDCDQLVPDSL